MTADDPPPNNDDILDDEVYCIRCGYSLHGLPGDVPRCPECGQANVLDSSTVPPHVVRNVHKRVVHQVQWLERCAAILALGVLLINASEGACCGFLMIPAFLWIIHAISLTRDVSPDESFPFERPVVLSQACIGLGIIGTGLQGYAIWKYAEANGWDDSRRTLVLSITSAIALVASWAGYVRQRNRVRATLGAFVQALATSLHAKRLRTPPELRGHRSNRLFTRDHQ